MKIRLIKQSIYFLLVIIITLGVSISVQSLLAMWINPTAFPPGENLSEPINVSEFSQYKAGSLGIGTTTLVAFKEGEATKLRIADLSQNPELQLQFGTDTVSDHWAIYNKRDANNNSSDNNSFNIWGGGQDRLIILQNGNISIGTSSPVARLQIESSTNTEGLRIISDKSGSLSSGSPLNIRNSNNEYDIFRVDTAGVLKVGSIPWDRLTSIPTGLDTDTGDDITSITAGTGVTITGTGNSRTIAATGGVYTAGTGISISSSVISNTG
ncbi:MAG: hypothetical protein Q7T79_00925, partial [bacterium]|nr:hypothetical protein [bacterium]